MKKLFLFLLLVGCASLAIRPSIQALTCNGLPPTFDQMVQRCKNLVAGEVEAIENDSPGKQEFANAYKIRILSVLKTRLSTFSLSGSPHFFKVLPYAWSRNSWGWKKGEIGLFCVSESVLLSTKVESIFYTCDPPWILNHP